jgi:hypothetical protein
MVDNVNSTEQEAEHSHQIAVAIVTILREMDRLKQGFCEHEREPRTN